MEIGADALMFASRVSAALTAQVSGRAALPWHERIELDLWYIEHWSLRLDLRILVRTAQLLREGAALLDATGVTRRRGDVRVAGPRLPAA